MLRDELLLIRKMERRHADADTRILYRGRFLTRLTARRFQREAGTRAVPDGGEPGREGRSGTDSGKGCSGLAQAGSTLV